MTKTLSTLRSACKKHGIGLKKETFSWGPHISFIVGGIRCGNVLTQEILAMHRDAFDALETIKQEFHGMTIDGQKVYGLK
jgi:hypothetical protein